MRQSRGINRLLARRLQRRSRCEYSIYTGPRGEDAATSSRTKWANSWARVNRNRVLLVGEEKSDGSTTIARRPPALTSIASPASRGCSTTSAPNSLAIRNGLTGSSWLDARARQRATACSAKMPRGSGMRLGLGTLQCQIKGLNQASEHLVGRAAPELDKDVPLRKLGDLLVGPVSVTFAHDLDS